MTLRTGSAIDAPVLYGWSRAGGSYSLTRDGYTFRVFAVDMPRGREWQLTVNDQWPGTDPFPFKRDAVDYVSDGVHVGREWTDINDRVIERA